PLCPRLLTEPTVIEPMVTNMIIGIKSIKDKEIRIKCIKQQGPLLVLLHAGQHFVDLLADQDRDMRKAALEAFAQQGSLLPEVFSQVVTLLADQDWRVRVAAQQVLATQEPLVAEMLRLV